MRRVGSESVPSEREQEGGEQRNDPEERRVARLAEHGMGDAKALGAN